MFADSSWCGYIHVVVVPDCPLFCELKKGLIAVLTTHLHQIFAT